MADRRPVIAIVGSADPARRDELELKDPDGAPDACEALGRELASRGADIIVYSTEPKFIEADVVRGYVGSGHAQPRSIQVRLPVGGSAVGFDEVAAHPGVFDHRPDANDDWEVSFYRSLVEVDGVLLLGGGRSTYVTGLIALTFRIPLVAIAGFGGYAQRVWQGLDRTHNDATEDEIAAMGQPWRDELAEPLVASLHGQMERRDQRAADERKSATDDARRERRSLLVAAVLMLAALTAIPITLSRDPGTVGSLSALVGAPVLSAAAGAIMRQAHDRAGEWLRAGVMGMVAGIVASLLFIAAQLLTTPDILTSDDAPRLLFFLLPVSFIAGLTSDDVYRKLRGQDVVRTDALQP